MSLDQFIKSMQLDENNRILISIHEFLESYLQTAENRKMIKNGLMQMLGEDFKQLEIGKNVCRITVTEGHEEEILKKLESDLKSAVDMAMAYMASGQKPEGPLN